MSAANATSGFILGAGFSSQCFPVRSLTRYKRQDDDGGAWLVAYRAEQRRRFKAVICGGDPISQRQSAVTKLQSDDTDSIEEERPQKLDGFFLMKHFHVDDPSDLCSVNISGQELREVNENDFLLFDNVIHVDAGDNNLPFEAFSKFSALQELELPLNNISNNIRIQPAMFPNLINLDLSYNRLTGDDILALGLLESLRTLHLTGNEIKKLPVEMTRTYRTITGMTPSGTIESEDKRLRFPALENLYLDHNELTDLSTFASLAGLKRLKYLNLEHNEISSIPHLRLLGARVNHGDSSRHENVQTVNSSLPDVLEEDVKDFQKEDESFENKEEIKRDGKKGNAKELNLDEVDDMLSRNLVSDEHGEEKKRPELKPRSSTLTEDPSLLGDRYNPPLPFASLLHLNLANNLIFEEDGLLALMGWPSLRELVIWGNPLTTAFKGDPPVLSLQLGRLKGVRIFRQKPPKRPKPIVNLANNQRKVKDTLPPMPKKQNLAMLEAPPEPKSTAHVGPPYKTLPPIGSAPPTGRQRDTATPRKLSTAPGLADTTPRGDRPSFSRTNTTPLEFPESAAYQSGHTTRQTMKTEGDATASESLGTADGRHQPRAEKHLNSEDGFFMTQIDEQEDAQNVEAPVRKVKEDRERERPFSVETKYKGYEDLLDVDEDDPDVIVPKDLQGSVRALNYALAHPLIFSEPHGTYKEKRVKKPQTVSTSTGTKSRQSKVEELGGILDKMRVQSKTKESNLETALQDLKKDPKLKQEYREAKKLLNEVQTKYNEVRVASLKPTSTTLELFGTRPEERTKEKKTRTFATPQAGVETLGSNKNIAKELKRFKEKIDSRL
ncbi:X-ray radiation resistance-associated protein 1 [Pocillopora verrucosa]|uniref:X-ray radiation resistance-associated protein 1 n=1 Tax=Pocillopora verrucosa TaxID=203993 RepID=UPI00333FCD72